MNKEQREQRKAELIDLLQHPGWAHVTDFFDRTDKEVTEASTRHILNLKSSERQKWIDAYAGELRIIDRFRRWIAAATSETLLDRTKQKIEDLLK